MKFQQGMRRKAVDYEKDLVRHWKENKTFEKSIEQRPAGNAYVFYDGPPFITGVPHHGTLLSSIAKDVIPRYQTMKGKRVERVWGWDCHGLPAEVFTEKKLGIVDRRDIGTKISLEDYILTCRENMVQTGSLWEDTIARIGRWVNFGGAYKTMDKDYMESVWWAFKTLYDQGKIYEGEKVLLYCTRDATPLSKAEVTMDAGSYQDVNDPSVYVKFKLRGTESEAQTHLLAWTTTPWTLPANTAVAVNKDESYVEVELAVDPSGQPLDKPQRFILAEALMAKVLTDEKHKALPFTLVRTLQGSELVGREYEPLPTGRPAAENEALREHKAFRVWHADYVSMEEGTGIVHLAPAYGEEDYALSRQNDFPFLGIIDETGFYSESDWTGMNVWEANKPIAKELHKRGAVWKIEYVVHSYPHCYRCGTRLMYRAHPSWFMDIDGQRQLMLEQNENIRWFPEHIKHGRFQKNIEQAPDWNLSRDRFWATAMPVWKGTDQEGKTRDKDGNEYVKVVGSYAELKELSGVELPDYHRPWIDDITFDVDGVHYRRIDKVMDCWFESGSMPFAQFHYPFENKEKFEQSFPGDFIVEYIGQVRAWFYYVHAVNVALFGKNAYKNVITTGTLAGNDGRKMSKSYGNYTDPNELMDRYSADALRFLLMGSPVMAGEDFSLQDKDVQDVQRKLGMVWNMYDFFTMYAAVDGWEWDGRLDDPLVDVPAADGAPAKQAVANPLDRWIVSRVHQLTNEAEHFLDAYDVPNAAKPILPFLDDASNWYVRRSRRRFWRSSVAGDGSDTDKNDAYRTLHYVLVRLSLVLAPFTPFLAEELFLKLTGGELGESVHLLDWPPAGDVDEAALQKMAFVRDAINQGLAQRAAAGIKVRQPLAEVSLTGPRIGFLEHSAHDASFYSGILLEELNVKRLGMHPGGEGNLVVEIDAAITPELRREGMAREVIRHIQQARKSAGLNVDDRIRLELDTHDGQLKQAITEYGDVIAAETLASELVTEGGAPAEGYKSEVAVDGAPLALALAKAG